jgi:CheY-like chemotaxis protein
LLASQLRREIVQDDMQIVCVTGHANEDPRQSLEAGCDAHFVKPLNSSELEKLLSG